MQFTNKEKMNHGVRKQDDGDIWGEVMSDLENLRGVPGVLGS